MTEIRRASADDADAVAGLAAELAQSFEFSREQFRENYSALLAADDACLLLAVNGHEPLGYVLGFRHLTFYANGPVAWVEEIVVRSHDRGHGTGKALMSAFGRWAAGRGANVLALVAPGAAPHSGADAVCTTRVRIARKGARA